jgi:hypothetical protein
VAVLSEALDGVDAAWDDLTADERKELLRLLVKEVRVSKDRSEVEVDLYQGLAVVASLREEAAANTPTPDVKHPGHNVCDRDRLAREEGFEPPT